MKTKRDFISEITTNEANFKYCAENGVINGVLLVDIEKAMQEYSDQQLRLHDVVDCKCNAPKYVNKGDVFRCTKCDKFLGTY